MDRVNMRDRLLMILLSGIALGFLSLLEPLSRFWTHFHILGISWFNLTGVYLGLGLLIAIVAGVAVSLLTAFRSQRMQRLMIVAYYLTATFVLYGVMMVARTVRHALFPLGINLPYWIVFPVLMLLGGMVVLILAPMVVRPLLSLLIGSASGRISGVKVTCWVLIVGLTIPLTALKERATYRHAQSRAPIPELATRPNHDPIQNVVFILVDALRADHLGCYGYHRETSPVMDRLAAQSFRFANCFSQGNRTELSVGSLFTSLYPSMHHVRQRGDRASILAAERETLAESMRDAGLTTVSLANNPFVKREWGLGQGFDTLVEFHTGYSALRPYQYLRKLGFYESPDSAYKIASTRAEFIIDEALGQLSRLEDSPFFLYIHFMDVHHPYLPPYPYDSAWITEGAYTGDLRRLWDDNWGSFNKLPCEEEVLAPAELLRIIDLYDGAIKYVDHEIGRLLNELASRGLTDNTLVIITADHGAEFMEHGDIFHKTQFLYDEVTHVPLIVHLPGQSQGETREQIVRHIDLMPTLQDVFGVPMSDVAEGQSLLPILTTTARDWRAVPAYMQSYEFIGLRQPLNLLMYDVPNARNYFYNLAADPYAQTNVFESADCDSMSHMLMMFLRRISAGAQEEEIHELDPRTKRQLESLGYM